MYVVRNVSQRCTHSRIAFCDFVHYFQRLVGLTHHEIGTLQVVARALDYPDGAASFYQAGCSDVQDFMAVPRS